MRTNRSWPEGRRALTDPSQSFLRFVSYSFDLFIDNLNNNILSNTHTHHVSAF